MSSTYNLHLKVARLEFGYKRRIARHSTSILSTTFAKIAYLRLFVLISCLILNTFAALIWPCITFCESWDIFAATELEIMSQPEITCPNWLSQEALDLLNYEDALNSQVCTWQSDFHGDTQVTILKMCGPAITAANARQSCIDSYGKPISGSVGSVPVPETAPEPSCKRLIPLPTLAPGEHLPIPGPLADNYREASKLADAAYQDFDSADFDAQLPIEGTSFRLLSKLDPHTLRGTSGFIAFNQDDTLLRIAISIRGTDPSSVLDLTADASLNGFLNFVEF